jgi:hypothetical protein
MAHARHREDHNEGSGAPAPPGKFMLARRPARSDGPLALPEPVRGR